MLELFLSVMSAKSKSNEMVLQFLPGVQESMSFNTAYCRCSVTVGGTTSYLGSISSTANNTIQVPANASSMKVTVLEARSATSVLGITSSRLSEVVSWGDSLTNHLSFPQSTNLTKVPKNLPQSLTILDNFFLGCSSFNGDVSSWDVSNVVSISSLFNGAVIFNTPLNSWDTSKIVRMQTVFQRCSEFNQPLNNWNTANVTNMLLMFNFCTVFNKDLSGWSVSKVTPSWRSAFDQGCEAWQTSFKPKFSK